MEVAWVGGSCFAFTESLVDLTSALSCFLSTVALQGVFSVHFWVYRCPLPWCELGWISLVISVTVRWIASVSLWDGSFTTQDVTNWIDPCPTCQLHAPSPSISCSPHSASYTGCSAALHTYTVPLSQDHRVLSPPPPSCISLLTWSDGILRPCQLPKCTSSLILWEFCRKLHQSRCHLAV